MATDNVSKSDPSYGGIVQETGKTFYRFELPKPSIAFNSEEGIKVFGEAFGEGYMKGYFSIASQFRTQPETTFCGLASMIMVLNTLAIDPKKKWKGHYRWYDEDMLDCNVSKEWIKSNGLTFDQCVGIARCNSLTIVSKRPRFRKLANSQNSSPTLIVQSTANDLVDSSSVLNDLSINAAIVANEANNYNEQLSDHDDLKLNDTFIPDATNKHFYSLDEFREDIMLCCITGGEPEMIVCYSRLGLNQVGTGHFSPIGGYNKARDLVLIMDVARFKYPPHWVSVQLLYNGMTMVDSDNKYRSRGWMMCTIEHSLQSLVFRLNIQNLGKLSVDYLIKYLTPYHEVLNRDSKNVMRSGDYVESSMLCEEEHTSWQAYLHCMLINMNKSHIGRIMQSIVNVFGKELSNSHDIIQKKVFDGIKQHAFYKLFETKETTINEAYTKFGFPYINPEILTFHMLAAFKDEKSDYTWHNEIKYPKNKQVRVEFIKLCSFDETKYPELEHEILCFRKQLQNLSSFVQSLAESDESTI